MTADRQMDRIAAVAGLVAMSTHGHRLLGDLVFGTTASRAEHSNT